MIFFDEVILDVWWNFERNWCVTFWSSPAFCVVLDLAWHLPVPLIRASPPQHKQVSRSETLRNLTLAHHLVRSCLEWQWVYSLVVVWCKYWTNCTKCLNLFFTKISISSITWHCHLGVENWILALRLLKNSKTLIYIPQLIRMGHHHNQPHHQELIKMVNKLSVLCAVIKVVVNIMDNSHVKGVNRSSNEVWEGIWLIHAEAIEIVPLINIIEISANTAGWKSASKWEWEERVSL